TTLRIVSGRNSPIFDKVSGKSFIEGSGTTKPSWSGGGVFCRCSALSTRCRNGPCSERAIDVAVLRKMMKRGHDVESAPSIWRRRTAMEHYAGIDVSLELSSVCVVDAQGRIVREAKVASEPEVLVAFFASLGFAVKRIGLEAGPLSQWLH